MHNHMHNHMHTPQCQQQEQQQQQQRAFRYPLFPPTKSQEASRHDLAEQVFA
jgi:hypothetical protein